LRRCFSAGTPSDVERSRRRHPERHPAHPRRLRAPARRTPAGTPTNVPLDERREGRLIAASHVGRDEHPVVLFPSAMNPVINWHGAAELSHRHGVCGQPRTSALTSLTSPQASTESAASVSPTPSHRYQRHHISEGTRLSCSPPGQRATSRIARSLRPIGAPSRGLRSRLATPLLGPERPPRGDEGTTARGRFTCDISVS